MPILIREPAQRRPRIHAYFTEHTAGLPPRVLAAVKAAALRKKQEAEQRR